MQWIYVYFTDYVLSKNVFFKMILLYTIEQNLSFLRHLVVEISHLKYDAYCVIPTGASDLKLFVGGVLLISCNTIHCKIVFISIVLSLVGGGGGGGGG